MPAPPTVFDRLALSLHKRRFARNSNQEAFFLLRETADLLIDRLLDVNRSFDVALDLTAHGGLMAPRLKSLSRIGTVISSDIVPAFAQRALDHGPALVCDEETPPFKDGCLDLIVSNLALHWVNDLPGALVRLRQALRPDGLLMVGMLGGNTLQELRRCLSDAEIEIEGGISPRVSPFITVRDLGALLQRAGYALPVVDADAIVVTYDNPFRLMRDIRDMGEANAIYARKYIFSKRAIFERTARLYMERYANAENDAQVGRIPATFQVIWATAWAPAPGQPTPMAPGSANTRLSDALGSEEVRLHGEGES